MHSSFSVVNGLRSLKEYKSGCFKFFTQDHNLLCFYEGQYEGFFVERDKLAKAIKQWRKAGKKIERVRHEQS